ncbi:MAG: hypothetical protein LBQ18_05075 [Campylobacteraceae bacterium]|jgi:hypothetical protein|nr:hypothetical protein [Campylobacteraceae bacterium]
MAGTKSGVILSQDETLVLEIEAELWASASDPLSRLFGGLKRFIAKIFGFRQKGFVVITDKRVVESYQKYSCYVFNTGKIIKYLLPSGIKEIGYYKRATCGICCAAYHIYYEGYTQSTSFLLPNGDEAEAQKVVDVFYKAISYK